MKQRGAAARQPARQKGVLELRSAKAGREGGREEGGWRQSKRQRPRDRRRESRDERSGGAGGGGGGQMGGRVLECIVCIGQYCMCRLTLRAKEC